MTMSGSDSVIVAAIGWIEGVLLGSVATSLAVLAVAWVGYRLLTGELDVRLGLRVVLGCFILFGAGSIVRELMYLSQSTGGIPDGVVIDSPAPALPPVSAPSHNDPYAGASVPM